MKIDVQGVDATEIDGIDLVDITAIVEEHVEHHSGQAVENVRILTDDGELPSTE